MRARALAILAGLLMALQAVPPVQAQNSGLLRLSDRDDLFGWEAVGRVDRGRDAYCTGVLIAPDTVLTAAHCVFGKGHRQVAPASLRFRAGLRDGVALAERGVARIAVPDSYDPADPLGPASLRSDAALLKLAKPIPVSVADPFVIHEETGEGQSISVVSYGRGRDAALSWQRRCNVVNRWNGLFAFDCDVTHGSSGAPVFVRHGTRARILSLISAGGRTGDGTLSFGMALPAVVDGLKRQLRAGASPVPKNEGFRRATVGQGGGAAGAKFAKP